MRSVARRSKRLSDPNPRYSQTFVVFAAKTDKVFGMGEHLHGKLNNKNVEQVAYRHPAKGPVMLKDWHNVSYDRAVYSVPWWC